MTMRRNWPKCCASFTPARNRRWPKCKAIATQGAWAWSRGDSAIAVEKANFCLSGVKPGLIPATISPYVIKAMGENAAGRYFLTAERFFLRRA
jgi:hypothetical protein